MLYKIVQEYYSKILWSKFFKKVHFLKVDQINYFEISFYDQALFKSAPLGHYTSWAYYESMMEG